MFATVAVVIALVTMVSNTGPQGAKQKKLLMVAVSTWDAEGCQGIIHDGVHK